MTWLVLPILASVGGALGLGSARALRMVRHPASVSTRWCVALTGFLFAVIGWRWLSGAWSEWWLPTVLVLTAVAVPLALADARYRRLPNLLVGLAYPLLLVALGFYVVGSRETARETAGETHLGSVLLAERLLSESGGTETVVRILLAMLLFAGMHAIVHFLRPAALGAGDVKLAGILGAVLGAMSWSAVVLAAIFAALVTAIWAGVQAYRINSSEGIPHGPGLLGATWLLAVFPGVGFG